MRVCKISLLVIILFLVFLFNSAGSSAQGDVTIISQGVSKAVIIVGSKASKNDLLAARELAAYLNKISGATVDVKQKTNRPTANKTNIFVGPNAYLKKKNIFVGSEDKDVFIKKTVGADMLVLMGNGVRGTLYSVYSLLEDLGCRWFMPGTLGEVVPSSRTVVVGQMDVLEVPDFKIRNFTGDGDLPTLTKADWHSYNQWLLKNRINRGFEGSYTRYDTSNGRTGHAYRKIIPSSRFKDHPELFPLVNGQRQKAGQRCVSNPLALQAAENYVDDIFSTYRKHRVVSLSPNDGQRWCECEACVRMDGADQYIQDLTGPERSYSGRVFGYAGQVLDYMRAHHPNKYAVVFAYQRYSVPPSNFTPGENLIIRVTHNHNACDAHPIDSSCEINTWFRKNVLDKWSDLSANLWFHGYTYRWKACELPYPTYFMLEDDIRYLRAKGVRGYFAMAGKLNWGANGLAYYVLTKLLWDADTDVAELIEDYCEKFYGASASSMHDYFYLMADAIAHAQAGEAHLVNQPGLNLGFAEQFLDIYPPELLEQADNYLAAALAAADSQSVRDRIRIVRCAQQYSALFLNFMQLNAQSRRDRTQASEAAARNAGQAVLDYLQHHYVMWSVALKTSHYGAREIVERAMSKLN